MLHRLAGRGRPRPHPARREAPMSAVALWAEALNAPTPPVPGDEAPSPPGWHESSFELRRGLEVREIFRQASPG